MVRLEGLTVLSTGALLVLDTTRLTGCCVYGVEASTLVLVMLRVFVALLAPEASGYSIIFCDVDGFVAPNVSSLVRETFNPLLSVGKPGSPFMSTQYLSASPIVISIF